MEASRAEPTATAQSASYPAELGRIGCPGEVVCFGEATEPLYVALDNDRKPQMAVVAMGPLGQGRVAAVAHEGYLTTRDPCLGRKQMLW